MTKSEQMMGLAVLAAVALIVYKKKQAGCGCASPAAVSVGDAPAHNWFTGSWGWQA